LGVAGADVVVRILHAECFRCGPVFWKMPQLCPKRKFGRWLGNCALLPRRAQGSEKAQLPREQ
jgi:hypothetical protein